MYQLQRIASTLNSTTKTHCLMLVETIISPETQLQCQVRTLRAVVGEVIQTTGRCNFGKFNKKVRAGARNGALYSDFCKNPQALCDGPSEIKWIAGIFFWVSEVKSYVETDFCIVTTPEDS